MESIRIGKDIRVRWPINSSAPLDTLALRLELESPLGVRTEEAFTLEGGSVMFYYPGTRQRDPGTYALTLWANYGAEGQTAVDACHAFRLVGRTCQEAPGGEGLEISTVELPAGELAVGLQGASAYESWLATGHEGTEADFVAWLRQPSVDAAGQAGQAATKALEAAKKATEVAATLQAHDKAWGEAEALRVKAETDRGAAETKRQQDTAAAVKSANDAAREASDAAKEASAAATAANEAAGKVDAAIEAAMQAKELLFRDMWEAACFIYGGWTEERGYYLHDVDLTYKQAIESYNVGVPKFTKNELYRERLVVNFHNANSGGFDTYELDTFCLSNLDLVVFVLCANADTHFYASKCYRSFMYCDKLREIRGIINCANVNMGFAAAGAPSFFGCKSLESIRIHKLAENVWFGDSPPLSLESLSYIVTNAVNPRVITITVHPDVYAKLTDPENAEWYAVNTAAQAKQIAFATIEE